MRRLSLSYLSSTYNFSPAGEPFATVIYLMYKTANLAPVSKKVVSFCKCRIANKQLDLLMETDLIAYKLQ